MAQTIPKTFKIKVAMTLIKSQNVYKGPFETVDELNNVQALNGDYADVYETGTRWQFLEGVWVNTNDKLPDNPAYVASGDASIFTKSHALVQRDDKGHAYFADPEALEQGATKGYVDNADRVLANAIDQEVVTRQQDVSNIQRAHNAEVERATNKENALETSIQGLDTDIEAEATRAQQAEADLQTAIDNTVTDLENEQKRAVNAENANAQAINAEQIRAEAQEEALSQRINTLKTETDTAQANITKSLNDEITRAQQAEEALSEETATKLTRVENTADKQRAYTVQTNGEQAMLDVDINAVENTLVQRNANGQINAAEPTEDSNVATKKYVDNVDVIHQGQLAQVEAEITGEIANRKQADNVLADAIDNETARAKAAETSLQSDNTAVSNRVTNIEKVIPSAATADNQLADKDFVNSSIANNASNYVTSSASGDGQFASLAALNAGPWYLMGNPYTPTKNDYAVFINTDGSTWRSVYDGQFWVAAYKINDTPFTSDQLNAINSGVTAQLLAKMSEDIANRVVTTALASVLYGTDADGNQITKAISDFATALQGQKADTAYQKPAAGIPESDLTKSIQDALALARSALQSFTEKDPTVPAWAKNATKPAYTKAEVGLGNVDNTSDANKPVSTAQRTAIDAVQNDVNSVASSLNTHVANKNNPHGVTVAQIGAEPAFTKGTAFNKNFGSTAGTVCQGNDSRLSNARPASDVYSWAKAANKPTYTASEVGALPTSGGTITGPFTMKGAVYYVDGSLDDYGQPMPFYVGFVSYAEGGKVYYRSLQELKSDLGISSVVTSVAGRTGAVSLSKSDVGLGNVPNVNSQNASNLTSGTVSNALISSSLIKSGTNTHVVHHSDGTFTVNASGASAPYVINLSTSNWSGSSGNYYFTISASTHGKGTYPQVRTFVSNEETYDSPKVDASGNVTLYSNAKIALRVVIY